MNSYYAPDFDVKISGITMAADVRDAVLDLSYDNNIETADMFTVKLDNSSHQFTDSALFDIGQDVEIAIGYRGELTPMMLGEITAVNPSFPESGAPTITVTGYDKSHKLRHNRPGRMTFKYMNDSLIAAQVAAENLLIPVVDPSVLSARESVQQTGSDWAFLSELAERNFFQLFVYWDRLYFRFPRPQTEMVVLEWGKNLSSFSPRLSTSGQAGLQVIRGYDYKLAQSIVAVLPMISLGTDLDTIVERLGNSFVDQLASLGRNVIRDRPIDSYLDAAAFAKSVLLQLLDGLFEGSGSCIGLPQLRAGDMVEVRGIGKRFSGKYRLSKVVHSIGANGYTTQFEVTQKNTSGLLKSLRKKIAESDSPNRQEKQHSIVVGKVENNVDTEGLGRVQLSFPHLSDINLSNWARIATNMAGSGAGMYFLPDIGDEVLVMFERGSVDHPIVIGSVWNGQKRPPETNKGQNSKRVIRTKTGLNILLDETPGSAKLELSNGAGSSITLDSETGDIRINAAGNVTISSGAGGTVSINP